MKAFLDTYALIEIINNNENYKKLKISSAVTITAVLSETYYFFLRKFNGKTADFVFNKISPLAENFPAELIPEAMTFKFRHSKKRFSYIDAMGYTYALQNNMTFITGDRAFKGLKNVKIVR